MQPHMKRKQAVAGLSAGGRTVKRRASKACHCCRSRKVRCDVVESGIPCTNCRLDEVECLVTEGKRRRKSYIDGDVYQPAHNSPCASVDEENEVPNFPIFDDIDGLQEISASLDRLPAPNVTAYDEEISHHKPHMLYQTQGHRLSYEERTRRLSAIGTSVNAPLISPAATTHSMRFFPQPNSRAEIVLPQYIRTLPPRILSEDLDYLHRKGAFMIPETSLRNELLRSYVQYVHPYLPILDLQDFLTTIEKNDPNDSMSLLLFQAVMFAGSAYIDMRFLVAQGYDTRKSARKAFFHRVKMLYDFDYEVDRVTVVQAVLLMTYWYENPDDPKDVWHWIGIAISLARTIGINCDTSNSPMPIKTRKLWKRIWWSCYMRDRLVSIGMRRPMRIDNEHFDMPMLQLDDFETGPMSMELSRMLGGCPAVRDSSKRITLAKMCIALARLCQCITEVLAVQYSIMGHKLGATQETTVRLVPKKSAADPCDVIRCDRLLEAWHKSQPEELHYFTSESHERTSTHDGDVISLHRALLTGVYLTAVSALHRPQIMPSMLNDVVVPELQELSRRKVRQAANDITEIFKDLTARDLVRYLPTTGVTVILPAIIIHLLDIKSNDLNTRLASIRKFQCCMQALQRLREMYSSADFAFSFLDAAVRRADVEINSVPPPNKAQAATTAIQCDQSKMQSGQVMLTPPPEASRTANRLLFACSLAPEERKLIAAFTPPESDHSLNSVMTGGAAIALTDLGMSIESANEEDDNVESIEQQEQRQANQLMDHENDFDALINLEGGADLFSCDEGLYSDLNMAWLNGLSDEHQGYHEDNEDVPMFEKTTIEVSGTDYGNRSARGITGDLATDLGVDQ